MRREIVIDDHAPPVRSGRQGDHLVTVLIACGLMLWSFLQRPGQSTFDTKFDLTADPGAFLSRSLHLWNQQSNFGELQNQAYGYLFPQGLFHLLGEWLALPDWVVQRLWSGLLLIVAYDGARRLVRALAHTRLEDPLTEAADSAWSTWPAHLAGFAFAASPRLLGLSGVLSAEVLPTAVLPWVVLPLVLAGQGRLTPRTGGLLSGVAVLLMGGVNAVENLAALPLPFFVVVAGLGTLRGRRLAGWWALSTTAAATWWMAPLLVLGKYSPPFLDYIETSSAVVNPLGWANTVRGADHWLAFIYVGGRPWWPGAYDLAYQPHLILATALVTALGIAGLGMRSMPLRGALIGSLVLGLVCMTVARTGPLAAPTQGLVQFLLDGPLSMLRNVHKVDPLVRLPLALGLGHLLVGIAAGTGRLSSVRRRTTALGLITALVVVSAQPLFVGTLRRPGWSAVPDAWGEAAAYVGEHARGATLVLPGSGFGQQTWGWTIDEPIQGLATTPWATRSQVPLTPGQTIRYLDAIEERVEDGIGSPRLASILRRAGISHIIVRRDLDLFAAGVPEPSRVDLALAQSPGLTRVAGFGRSGFGDQPLLEVYAVTGAASQPAEAVLTESVATMAGGPEDIVAAEEAGVLDSGRPVLFTTKEPQIVGDGYRRRERGFGRLHDAVSQVMSPEEPFRVRRSANDYPGVAGQPRVTARYTGIKRIVASSSGGYIDTLGAVRPELGPYSALDDILSTYWQSAPLTQPTGQWVELTLSEPTVIDEVVIVAGVDGVSGVPVRQLRVDVGTGSQRQARTVTPDPTSGEATVRFEPIRAETVRVEIAKVAGKSGVASLREIAIPGVRFDRALVIPDAAAGADTSFVFRARPHRRACISSPLGEQCSAGQGRVSEEERGLVRAFSLSEAGSWRLRGEVVALGSDATQQLLEPYLRPGVRVRASSTFHNEPGVGAQLAFDGNPTTYWMSDPSDGTPTLHLEWGQPRRLTSLHVVGSPLEVAAPSSAVIRAGKRVRNVVMGTNGTGQFEPLTTRRLDILFPTARTPEGEPVSVGVGELLLPGLGDLVKPTDLHASTGAVCGLGPEVEIDGRLLRTRVRGTIGDVLQGTPLQWRSCDGPVSLGEGEHEVRLRSTGQYAATAVTLAPHRAVADISAPVQRRPVRVTQWTTWARAVQVAPGSEAILRVPENANAGWQATLDGKRLRSVTIDGWQQGYVVPAGEGGRVTLVFAPDRAYRLALLLGLLAALGLGVAAAWSAWRDRQLTGTAPGGAD
ncbi:MAG: alpha-(1-_3)-arabinofuranosyltransferase family protein, partial [Nocardioides sp.]